MINDSNSIGANLTRIEEICQDAADEEQDVNSESYLQCYRFFEQQRHGNPRITLTPDGIFRARWITDDGFVAIEFIGNARVKVMEETQEDEWHDGIRDYKAGRHHRMGIASEESYFNSLMR